MGDGDGVCAAALWPAGEFLQADKQKQLDELRQFEKNNELEAQEAMRSLREVALKNGNIFEELLNTVRYVSLGQITNLLYDVGGKYRRNM